MGYLLLKTGMVVILGYLVMAVAYQLILAVAYTVLKDPTTGSLEPMNRFVVLIPAHNEELLISLLCENISSLNYPRSLYKVVVVADNCTDSTANICKKYPVDVLIRNDPSQQGKGFALQWALDKFEIGAYDAVLIIDADTTVDKDILQELNKMLNKGEEVIQCYIEVPNRNESWFTQIIFVSRTINNLLYHFAKYKLGLSAYLMGTGMCFRSQLLQERSWTAFSLSEDWEYYALLIKDKKKIAFADKAIVYQQESKSLSQATTQRLRWASGKFYVIRKLGLPLLLEGIIQRSYIKVDSALALIFPNWSLQINMIFVLLIVSYLLPISPFRTIAIAISCSLVLSQILILLMGIRLSKNYWAVTKTIIISPIFLVWKFSIDLLCVTGIYKGKKWIRTKRHITKISDKQK